jgi:predicted small lipoprotein YifL
LARTQLSKRLRAGFVLALLGVAAISLAACGRNGPPELPPGPIFSSYQPPAAEPAAQPTGAPAIAAPPMPAPPGSPEDLREKQYEKAAQNGKDENRDVGLGPEQYSIQPEGAGRDALGYYHERRSAFNGSAVVDVNATAMSLSVFSRD